MRIAELAMQLQCSANYRQRERAQGHMTDFDILGPPVYLGSG